MNKLKKLAISLAVLSFVIVSVKSSLASTGKVTATTVRLRQQANTESEILEKLSQGTEVEVISLDGDWYRVSFNEKEGYIHKDYLEVTEEPEVQGTVETSNENVETETTEEVQEEVKEDVKEEKAMEIGDTINKETNAYLLPNFMSTKILKLEQGKKIKLKTTMANWAKIEVDGKEAWIPKTLLMKEVETTSAEPVQENEENKVEEEKEQEEQKQQEETDVKPLNKAAYISSNASANLRSGPSTDTDSIGKLTKNTKITITGETGEWYKVSYNGKEGYVYKTLVSEGEPPAETSSRSQTEARTATTTETANNAEVAETKIETSTETTTAAAANTETTVASATASSSSSSVVEIAKKYLGCKYVYGGSSPSGFDCSGFTSYVYGQCGISLARTSYAQASQGTAVSKSELQPGDLLLFTTNGSSGGISHVGIYVGNGQFIHAANATRGVVYDTINSGYYATNYAGARRI